MTKNAMLPVLFCLLLLGHLACGSDDLTDENGLRFLTDSPYYEDWETIGQVQYYVNSGTHHLILPPPIFDGDWCLNTIDVELQDLALFTGIQSVRES